MTPTRPRGSSLVVDASRPGPQILQRFGRSIRERHTFARDAYNVSRLPGTTAQTKFAALLSVVGEELRALDAPKSGSFSIFIEGNVLHWLPRDVPAVRLYFGNSAQSYPGSPLETLHRRLRAHPAYLATQTGSPGEDSLFFGYYSPVGRVFYLAREFFFLVKHAWL